MPATPRAGTGEGWSIWLPRPSCPDQSLPQTRSVPSVEIARECEPPAESVGTAAPAANAAKNAKSGTNGRASAAIRRGLLGLPGPAGILDAPARAPILPTGLPPSIHHWLEAVSHTPMSSARPHHAAVAA